MSHKSRVKIAVRKLPQEEFSVKISFRPGTFCEGCGAKAKEKLFPRRKTGHLCKHCLEKREQEGQEILQKRRENAEISTVQSSDTEI